MTPTYSRPVSLISPSGALRIDPKAKGAQKLDAAIKAWQDAQENLKSGKMTRDGYGLRRVSFK